MTGGLRLALRLAWRNARSHRLATFLTALLVAVPVVALVAAAVLTRSAQIPASEQDRRTFGAADVLISQNSGTPMTPALPIGSSLLITTQGTGAFAGPLRGAFERRGLSYDAPLAAGLIHQRAGRAPRSPNEVVATTYLADRAHLHLGQVLQLKGIAGPLTLVGTIIDPNDVTARTLIGPSGSLPANSSAMYLVGLPRGGQLHLSNNYSEQPRAGSYHSSRFATDQNSLHAGALVVVLALLEAALTAGTAFAVGARRGRRDLALVAVNGGGESQVSAMVFANGVVCGVIGVVTGVVLGLVAGYAGLPLLQQHTSQLLVGVRLDPKLIAAAALFGLISSILACILPARLAARNSLRAALGGARGVTRTPRWVSVTGLAVATVGVLFISRGAASFASNRTTVVLLGVVLLELGGVALCPALIGVAGRLGSRLPALPRLALRDAARQRARSGPAVAAIAAAVSGAIAVSVYVASSNLHEVRTYIPQITRDAVVVSDTQPIDSADLKTILGPTAARLAVGYRNTNGYARMTSNASGPSSDGTVVVGNLPLLRLLGANVPAEQAFMAGTPVAGGAAAGKETLTLQPDATNPNRLIPVTAVTAGWSSPELKPALIVPANLAPQFGLALDGFSYQAPIGAQLSNSARVELQARARDLGYSANVDTGPPSPDDLVALALLVVAVIFSLIVTAAATALAAAESRSDLAILGAIGATGRVRRLFTAAQGATTALLGAVLGIAIGIAPGIAVVHASLDGLPLVLPWQPFLAFLVGLPLVAGLGGLLLSRSRLPGAPRSL